MSPRRRVLLSALIPGFLLIMTLAGPAYAQFYDVARGSLGFTLDGIERSPGLLGMGALAFVGDDYHSKITLWDFAANPVGILEADSTNTIELYPVTSSYSGIHDIVGAPGQQRQDLAARETRFGYELWRRTGRAAYGLAGNLGFLRMDHTVTEGTELRSSLRQPTVMPVLVGHMPYVRSSRWLYSARLIYSGESSKDQYRDIVATSGGQYIDQTGTELGTPEFFTPTDYSVRTTGAGLGLAYDRGRALKAAVNMDVVQNTIKGSNDAARHSGSSDEKRPYRNGQATLVGRFGRDLEWGVDGREWSSHSEQHWFFSVSAGVGADPLTGRGKLLERDETGRSLRTRLRWTRGPFQLGGGVTTGYQRLVITPPGLGDLTSFNYFRNTASHRINADSLVFPDSVNLMHEEQRSWEAGAGISMRLPHDRGTVGVEFHRLRGLRNADLSTHAELDPSGATIYTMASQSGPLRRGWDVRTGLEYRLTSVLTGRAGYRYRREDQDVLTQQNEYLGNSMTLGFGLRPSAASWVVETGYAIEWQSADFGSPAVPRASRQQLASLIRWVF
jgi:hypothetical protein